ncbi:tousled-like kinase [Cordyceps militaris]|uniref:non-specific serine/threonine protein kinase n=1 Tax=Cordyceps militaris TaxID=73501 RepID=A0A2H4SA98_CORMI|nr:tousled-like kinase [Cordyceps militaris]
MDKTIAYDPNVVAYILAAPGAAYEYSKRAVDKNKTYADLKRHGNHIIPPHIESASGPVGANNKTSDTEDVGYTTSDPDDDLQHNDGKPWETGYTIRFDEPTKTNEGFVFGTDYEKADFALPSRSVASRKHFALTFDAENHLIVRDLESTNGTRLIYSDPNATDAKDVDEVKAKQMEWSARGPSMTNGFHPIIDIRGKLRFQIVVPTHIRDAEYFRKVAEYCQGAHCEDIGRLGIQNIPDTISATPVTSKSQRPSELSKSEERPFWRKKIGEGSFGVVYYAWDVKTRDVVAIKQPRQGHVVDLKAWDREASVMSGLKHPNIVELLQYIPRPPQLLFEYAPGQSLSTYITQSTSLHNKQIAVQLMDGLRFLHNRDDPIVHRDIKPGNVLVQEWNETKVHVKLGDFGFAKEEDQMANSRVGTPAYWAPEVTGEKKGPKYDCQVDIWSLGALLLTMECKGLPSKTVREFAKIESTAMPQWAYLLICFGKYYGQFVDNNTPVLDFALRYMLKLDPEDRLRAEDCFRAVKELLGQSTDSGTVPSPGQRASSDGGTLREASVHGDGEAFSRDPGHKSRASGKVVTPTPDPSPGNDCCRAAAGAFPVQNMSTKSKDDAGAIASPPRRHVSLAGEIENIPDSLGATLRMAMLNDLAKANADVCNGRVERLREVTGSKRERPENKTTASDECQQRGQNEVVHSTTKRNRLK